MLRCFPLALALAGVLVLSGCGRENKAMIPPTQAQALTRTVDEIAQRTEAEDCDLAGAALQEARSQVTELPGGTSVRLRRNLNQWLDHLADEIPKDCTPAEEETPTATPDETETPTPTATPDETETPTATPTETPAPEETPTPEPTVEPPGTGGVLPGNEDDG